MAWLLLLVSAALPAVAAAPAFAQAPKRNVLLIVADDLGNQLGCYGDPVVQTPNLDALAGAGTRFTHAFATTASCSASRAVLYTGLYTHTNGQYGHAHMPHDFFTHAKVRSVPKILREAGWFTGILGKLHVQPAGVYTFDFNGSDGPRAVNPRSVAAVAARAGEFFTESGERPFFLIVGYTDPHRSAGGFGNEKPYPGVTERTYDPAKVVLPAFLPDIPEARKEWAEYCQSISRLDQGVGFLLAALKRSGKAENTLVIFLSDNGPPFPGAKTTVYDTGTRLPLIIAAPAAVRRGVVNSAMLNWTDIGPTILDWAGAKPAAEMPGRSVLPVLGQENPAGWDEVFASHCFHELTNYYPMRSIRTRKYRYILNVAHGLDFSFASDLYGSKTWQAVLSSKLTTYGKRTVAEYIRRPKEELYDVESDPDEVRNLAADPKYAAVLAQLRAQVKAMREKTKDPWLHKEEYE
jgi:N-sulfoglucosamine sulfohydrolase